MNDPKSRPALKPTKADIGDYDVIFIGYPIWWNQAPRVVNTFIESHDLKGRKLVPFATSGGSSITNSVKRAAQGISRVGMAGWQASQRNRPECGLELGQRSDKRTIIPFESAGYGSFSVVSLREACGCDACVQGQGNDRTFHLRLPVALTWILTQGFGYVPGLIGSCFWIY